MTDITQETLNLFLSQPFLGATRYYARRFGLEAEELRQETILKVLNKQRYFDPHRGILSAWARTILMRTARDMVRSQFRRRKLTPHIPLTGYEKIGDRDLGAVDELLDLEALLTKVPPVLLPIEKEIVTLTQQGRKPEEIASVLNRQGHGKERTVESVRQSLKRAKKKLRRLAAK